MRQIKTSRLLFIKTFFLGISMLLGFACQSPDTVNMLQKELNDNWTYQQVNGEFTGEASVPGVIQTDLMANKQIEAPFYRTNEKELQWIDKEDWEYTSTFEVSAEEFAKDKIVLDFKGLDTYATVFLNGTQILESNNMFREYKVDIKSMVKLGQNDLKVYFHSPTQKGLELLNASAYPYPASNDQSENGGMGENKVSIFTRKAGYHYGWDWGPRFVTSGIWRPIVLKAWNQARIQNVFIKQPSITAELAKLEAVISIESEKDFKGKIEISDQSNGVLFAEQSFELAKGAQQHTLSFEIANPELWWSAGLGEAHLYNFEIRLNSGNTLLASESVTTGLRDIKLIREKDEQGESFLFEINGVRIFAKGANYIPNDSFLPRVSDEDYEKVVADAVNANMNMLRIWGGGIYENDIFYDLCDKHGILVWQDFMFACSMYPGDDAFLANVKEEAIDNVIRLRNHPSIALWCGNNEINTAWNHYSEGGWGWKQRYTKDQQEEIQKAYLDLFHGVLPEVVEQHANGTDYWPSSPQAGYEPQDHTNYEATSGDMHYWGVWHGLHPFEDFDKYKARFMSEYGFQSFPDFETVKTYALPEDYDIESDVMAAHQRSGIGNLRIKEYMSWDYNVPKDFEQFLYMSQVLQARGIKAAIEAHRRAMPYCMGTLYWQLNDCWPVASWSSTDYYHKWKALHYAVKRSFDTTILSAFAEGDKLNIYGITDELEGREVNLKLSLMDFEGNTVKTEDKKVKLNANTSTLLYQMNAKSWLKGASVKDKVLVMQIEKEGKQLAQNLYYFAKPKDLDLPQALVEVRSLDKDGDQYIELFSDRLVRDLNLSVEDPSISFEDNSFDLLPNHKKLIKVLGNKKLAAKDIKIMHLSMIAK